MHPRTEHLIDLALEEDAGLGDLTSRAIFPKNHACRAFIEAGQDLVLCGIDVAARVFSRVDPKARVKVLIRDGARVRRGRRVLEVSGSTEGVLTAERTALNFLQRLSGIATLSSRYAKAVASTGVRIVDTRKTTPGFRALEKYAVRCGGCHNHRSSLGEHVLIKDNHIAAAGSVSRAVSRARAGAPHLCKIEAEAKSLAEVRQALKSGADAILLDNMTPEQVARAVSIIKGRARVEVSGGVRFETLGLYAIAGVDVISVGALTHSAPAADLSLTVVARRR